MQILAVITGEYGTRHVNNIIARGPHHWKVHTWTAPTLLPLIIDYPEEYVPKELPHVDMILSFAEHKGVAELIPDVAEMTGARAVIAPVDNEAWLPRGLARQLRGWLEDMGVASVTPKPLCSLTDYDYGVTRGLRITYEDALISEFATHFGQPDIKIRIDPQTRRISSADVKRDTVCGCAHYVAQGLIGMRADEAEEKAGLLHHHYPCLASMGKDTDFGDTLMHISGNVLKDNISSQVKPFKLTQFISPGNRSE